MLYANSSATHTYTGLQSGCTSVQLGYGRALDMHYLHVKQDTIVQTVHFSTLVKRPCDIKWSADWQDTNHSTIAHVDINGPCCTEIQVPHHISTCDTISFNGGTSDTTNALSPHQYSEKFKCSADFNAIDMYTTWNGHAQCMFECDGAELRCDHAFDWKHFEVQLVDTLQPINLGAIVKHLDINKTHAHVHIHGLCCAEIQVQHDFDAFDTICFDECPFDIICDLSQHQYYGQIKVVDRSDMKHSDIFELERGCQHHCKAASRSQPRADTDDGHVTLCSTFQVQLCGLD
jgi:hypothetical protein